MGNLVEEVKSILYGEKIQNEGIEKSNPYPRGEHGQWGCKPNLIVKDELSKDTKKIDIEKLHIVSKKEFSRYVDELYNSNTVSFDVIRLPNINERLCKQMGIENKSCYFTKRRFKHSGPVRKSAHKNPQDIRIEEFKRIPEIIHNSNVLYWDKKNRNFFIPFLDRLNKDKANKICFTQDKKGNYAVTVGKVDLKNITNASREYLIKVGVGVAPTIHKSIKNCPNPCLSVSPTYISNISQNKIKSTNTVNKSIKNTEVEINIKDVTVGNRQAKIDCLEKAFTEKLNYGKALVEYVEKDDTPVLKDIITLRISNFDKSKIDKAVRTLSFSLDTELKAPKGEAFTYKAQEDLTNMFVKELTEKTKELYSMLISYFGLPEIRILSKANLVYKGKVVYSPETGKPITEKEWAKFCDALEKFLNRNYKGIGKRIILSAESLGRILDRLTNPNKPEEIKKLSLEELKYKGKRLEWIAENIKNMTDVFGESLSRTQQAKIQVMTQSAAQRVTNVTDKMRGDIQQILIDGVKNHQSKSVVSQNLFDKCVGLNRDFQRIADTEIQNATNEAYINEEVYKTPEGEKVYFKRFEIVDGNTCKKCEKIKGMIALYSDTPLSSQKIVDDYADIAIWEGCGLNNDKEIPIAGLHPWCRGSWIRYYPEADALARGIK